MHPLESYFPTGRNRRSAKLGFLYNTIIIMSTASTAAAPDRYNISVLPSCDPYHSIAADVSGGLDKTPQELPERYLYDELGSSLFDRICEAEEYYPTQVEESLIADNTAAIVEIARPQRIIELGSGSSLKTRRLFDEPTLRQWCDTYVAIDVSLGALQQAMATLSIDYPWLTCQAIAGDYADALTSVATQPPQKSLYLFLGGTIGNFNPANASTFLKSLHKRLSNDDCLLIGIDAVKSVETLTKAYNDKEQHTARFNLNMLRVINRELGADFDLDKFRHRAEFIDDLSAVQMTLISTEDQVVSIPSIGKSYQFKPGEKIITEHSYKYTQDRAKALLNTAGFTVKEVFSKGYHLILAQKAS